MQGPGGMGGGGPPAIPRTDIIMSSSGTDLLQGYTSASRRDWVLSNERLVDQATALGDAGTVRMVEDVVGALRQMEGDGSGDYQPLPFGGRPTVVLPSLLSFRPTPARNAEERRSRAEQISRSPVLFGATGY
jgi:hypothetical protein